MALDINKLGEFIFTPLAHFAAKPQHEIPTMLYVRPAKAQTSLRIRAVLSESAGRLNIIRL